MRKLAPLLALLLLACDSGGGSRPPPVASCPQWTVQYSRGVPPCITDGFDFPQSDGVHYIVRPAPNAMNGKTVTLRFAIEGDGKLVAVQDEEPKTARLRLYVQRKGDNVQGPFGRWWSRDVELTTGENVIAHKLIPDENWSSVLGQVANANEAAFNGDINNAGHIGFTFGGMFAGHGVYAIGTVRFRLIGFEVLP